MLEKQVNGFIAYCKMSGFKDRLIKSLSLNLNKFKIFLSKIHVRSIKKVSYRNLLSSVFMMLNMILFMDLGIL